MNEAAKQIWDVAVIGGGPAGMMAAGRAAERGLRVILIEKNASLGKKLLITGGGRCNVTNNEPDDRKLLACFKDSGKFLFSAFAQWSVPQTLQFFHLRAMPTKVEAEQRVFPATEKAQSVWDALVGYLRDQRVTVLSKAHVKGFLVEDSAIAGVSLKSGGTIRATSVILATGGKSHPETGSTGDGFAWLRALGHTVTEPTASLVPIALSDAWIPRVAGLTLPAVKLTVLQNGIKQAKPALGKILFTHVGASGPTILNMSREIGDLLKYGEVTVSLDLLPALDYSALNTRLQEIFAADDKKKFKNCLGSLLPASLAPVVVELSGIDADKQCNGVTRDERLNLVKLLKHLLLHVKGLLGDDKAIITSGGVALEEVDFKTMRSRKYPNLYLAGDILDIDRPSGGFSLQLCWTTGFVAGNSASADTGGAAA